MGLEGRIAKLEQRLGAAAAPLVVVVEAADGTWREAVGEAVDRAALPAGAQVIVFRKRPDGPQ